MMTGARHRIGLLGGTFDPIHLAHLRLAEEAADQLGLERVLFVPAPNPWRKAGRRITPVEHRLAMVRLATAGNDRFEVSTIELEQEGPTYTAHTLQRLQAQFGQGVQFFFILGADALRDLPRWHKPELIISLAQLAVTRRPRTRLPDADELERLVPGVGAAIHPVEMTPLSISSTAIRRLIASGNSVRYLVPDAVAAYITEHSLYRW